MSIKLKNEKLHCQVESSDYLEVDLENPGRTNCQFTICENGKKMRVQLTPEHILTLRHQLFKWMSSGDPCTNGKAV